MNNVEISSALERENRALRERLAEVLGEREALEKALRDSEARFRDFLDNTPAVAFMKDPEGRQLYANKMFEKVFNTKLNDVLGKTDVDLFPPEVARQLREHDAQVLATNQPLQVIETVPTADGVLRSWLVYKFPFWDASGRRCLGGVAVDITDLVRTEQLLRESEERHRVCSELTSDYTFAGSVDADHNIHIETVSAGFTKITGYPPNFMEGADGWRKLIHPDDLSAVAQNPPWWTLPEIREAEIRIIAKDQSVHWIRYSLHPIRDNTGRIIRVIGAVQDVTEQKRSEDKLRDYAQSLQLLSRRLLEVQEQERRRLARELHDEIGQILTAVTINLQTARRLTVSEGDAVPVLDEGIGIVQQAIRQVRNLSLDLRPSMLDDLGLEAALRWYVEWQAQRTGLAIHLHINIPGARLPAEFETACYRLIQEALTNVLRHARARQVWIELMLNEQDLHIQVCDDGDGFDLQNSRQQGNSENGFGLLGMRERVEWLGGRFAIESHPGRGTMISAQFKLPS
jgi:PAS domain S-box-containing protein